MEQVITVATFNDKEPAERVATRLRDAGFHSEVLDETNAQKWMLLNFTPRAHMRVRVPKDEGERAQQQLEEWDKADGAMAAAVRCPDCGSSNVEFPQFTRRSLMGSWPALLATAGIIEKDYYCESCQFTWPDKPEEAGPELDILNWPKT
jgi:hypothetical protein